MAKVSIKSEKITLFGGIFHVREHFSRFGGPVIDKVLGLRCTSFGYQYSEVVEFYNLRGGNERIFDDTIIGSSRAREFHPHPLTEPCVKVSPHTALHTQLFVQRHNLGV